MSMRHPQHHECPCKTCQCKFEMETTQCRIWRRWFFEEWAWIRQTYGGEDAIKAYQKRKREMRR